MLTVHSRDLHNKANPDSRPLKNWNVDSAWFSAEEAKSLLPENANVGDSFDFPAMFVERICRFHLVDCVKGQTDSFKKPEVADSKIRGKVTSVNSGNIEIQIKGTTSGVSRTGRYPRGVVTNLIGDATFDKTRANFTSFNMVAIGKRRGRTKFNDRVAQQGESPIGYSFQLSTPQEPTVIPGIIWGYDASWMKFSQ